MANELGTPALHFEREGSIAWCVIDRPHARNALTPGMYYGIKRAVTIVNQDPDLAALIITGVGDVFAPGGDLGGRSEEGETFPDVDRHRRAAVPRRARQPGAGDLRGERAVPGRWAAHRDAVRHRGGERPRHVPRARAAARDHRRHLRRGAPRARGRRGGARPHVVGAPLRRRGGGAPRRDQPHGARTTTCARPRSRRARGAADRARRRVLTKRMLHDRYEPIDYQTMFWGLEHSPEPREGMTAFMEKRQPNWIPDDA